MHAHTQVQGLGLARLHLTVNSPKFLPRQAKCFSRPSQEGVISLKVQSHVKPSHLIFTRSLGLGRAIMVLSTNGLAMVFEYAYIALVRKWQHSGCIGSLLQSLWWWEVQDLAAAKCKDGGALRSASRTNTRSWQQKLARTRQGHPCWHCYQWLLHNILYHLA